MLVHDAVRPFVDQETIVGVIEAVKKYAAAIAGVPAVDTVKQVDRTSDGAVVIATVPRERMVLAQTPQGFRFALLKKAFDEATADGFLGTDEASLIERSGAPVHVVMGSPRNLKITTPGDLELAEFFLSQDERRKGEPDGIRCVGNSRSSTTLRFGRNDDRDAFRELANGSGVAQKPQIPHR